MYCQELDRLLDTHSSLTLEFFRQDVRTQDFYSDTEDWLRECRKLEQVEEQLQQVTAALADHRRGHGCAAQYDSAAPPVHIEAVATTEEHRGARG
jgi:DNA phosphorothioation-dependent restriction protein DptG